MESNAVDSFMVPDDVSLISSALFPIRGLLIGVDILKRGWKLSPRSTVEQVIEGHKGFTWTALLRRFGFGVENAACAPMLVTVLAGHWIPTSRVSGFTFVDVPTVYKDGTAVSVKYRIRTKPISYRLKFLKHSSVKCLAHRREFAVIPPSSKCKNWSQRARRLGCLGIEKRT